jgi:hypothetical protein
MPNPAAGPASWMTKPIAAYFDRNAGIFKPSGIGRRQAVVHDIESRVGVRARTG